MCFSNRHQSINLQSKPVDWFLLSGTLFVKGLKHKVNTGDISHDLVPFLQFKKHQNTHGGVLVFATLLKV